MNGSFFIQPVEDYTSKYTNIKHAFYRIPNKNDRGNMNKNLAKEDQSNCDTPDSQGEFLTRI